MKPAPRTAAPDAFEAEEVTDVGVDTEVHDAISSLRRVQTQARVRTSDFVARRTSSNPPR